ncbi:MAG: DUF1566 domain-containing protein, partial [Treponema sp.]|nr:DUF1566 domain-containing protein [Treponema sp.]
MVLASGGGTAGTPTVQRGNTGRNTTVPATPVQSSAPPPAPTTYKIGDTGPAGGIVFYDMGFSMNGWRYLEAASADIPGVWPWGAADSNVNGTTNGIGNGKRNTQIIVELLNQKGETMQAAQVADAYEQGEFGDWFLPSKDELDLMYKNLKAKGLGGFQSGSYWTSSELSASFSWYQKFSNGEQASESKNTAMYIRV